MRILLLGGSKSGKSMMGQPMARRPSAGAPMYYWATLEPRDGEDRAIVRRHLAERDGWGFEPILADEENTCRAVELLGTIAMMLTGAFPMVTLIRRYLGKPLEKLGRLAGLEASGSVGLVACLPNGLVVEVVANPQTSQRDGVT